MHGKEIFAIRRYRTPFPGSIGDEFRSTEMLTPRSERKRKLHAEWDVKQAGFTRSKYGLARGTREAGESGIGFRQCTFGDNMHPLLRSNDSTATLARGTPCSQIVPSCFCTLSIENVHDNAQSKFSDSEIFQGSKFHDMVFVRRATKRKIIGRW